MDDIETSNVLFTVDDNTGPSHVAPTSDDHDISSIKLDKVDDLALLDIVLDGIVDMDEGVRVTNGATVVGDDVRNTLRTEGDSADFEKLVLRFLRSDSVDCESALDIIEESEVLARLFNGDDIHESCRKCGVGPNFSIDLDQALLDNGSDLFASQGIL